MRTMKASDYARIVGTKEVAYNSRMQYDWIMSDAKHRQAAKKKVEYEMKKTAFREKLLKEMAKRNEVRD